MHRRLNTPILVLTVILLLAFSCVLLGLASWPARVGDLRMEALQLWSMQSPAHYRIGIRAEAAGQTCFQQLEVRRGQVVRVLQNTCELSWLEQMSVPRLFDLMRQVERIPTSRCPNTQTCECHRVFQHRIITYDPQLGYPLLLTSRSEEQLNVWHPDFWKYTLQYGQLPQCQPAPRILRIETLWLTPVGE